jgi:2-hydroxy-3-oxopropionate reductase
MQQVGIVGLGLLGSAIAFRLRQAGYGVAGCDPDPARHVGADRIAASPSDLAGVEAVILSLPESRVSAQVLPQVPAGVPVIDTTTGDPEEMAGFVLQNPLYLDCTVAASSLQVRQNEATLMVGGSAEAFERARPVLEAFAKRIFHTGPCGSAARMKLVVNLALGLQRAVLGETLGFAEASGIDPALALEVLKASPAYAKAMDMKGARMLERRYGSPDARLRQHHKDVRLIRSAAERNRARIPLTILHDSLLDEAEKMGLGEADNSSIREVFRSRNI